jgi:hypothetical protein
VVFSKVNFRAVYAAGGGVFRAAGAIFSRHGARARFFYARASSQLRFVMNMILQGYIS